MIELNPQPREVKKLLLEKKGVIYARFSSQKQKDGFSIQAQIEACRSYADKNNIEIVNHYIDEAISGRTAERDAFMEMIDDSGEKGFHVVLVHKYDRFGRDRYDQIVFKRKLSKNGAVVVSVSEPVDHESPYGVVMESLYEALADSYSKNLAKESMKGMIQGAKLGFWQGRAPYGYAIEKIDHNGGQKNKLRVCDPEAEIVRRIFELYIRGGKGQKTIALEINEAGYKTRANKLFTPAFVGSILRNPVYSGTVVFNKNNRHGHDSVATENAHESIVTPEDSALVLSMLKKRHVSRSKVNNSYILSGLLHCNNCGSKMSGVSAYGSKGVRYEYYKCIGSTKHGPSVCTYKPIRREDLDNKVLNLVAKTILNKSVIKKIAVDLMKQMKAKHDDSEKDLVTIGSDLEDKNKRYMKLINVIEEGGAITYEDVAPRLRMLKNEIKELESRKVRITRFMDLNGPFDIQDKSTFKSFVNDLKKIVQEVNFLNKDSVSKTIEKIEMTDESADVFWKMPVDRSSYSERFGSPNRALYELLASNVYKKSVSLKKKGAKERELQKSI